LCNVELASSTNQHVVPTQHGPVAKATPAVSSPRAARSIDSECIRSGESDADDISTSAEHEIVGRICWRNVRCHCSKGKAELIHQTNNFEAGLWLRAKSSVKRLFEAEAGTGREQPARARVRRTRKGHEQSGTGHPSTHRIEDNPISAVNEILGRVYTVSIWQHPCVGSRLATKAAYAPSMASNMIQPSHGSTSERD
jgi:hypothetical protein